MAAPFQNLRSKLNRAICAWLVNQGCGSVNDILPATIVKSRPFPNTTVRGTIGRPEIQLTGIYRIQVQISIKGSASKDPSETNPALARTEFGDRVARTFDALMQGNDGATLAYTASQITAAGRALAVPVDSTPQAIQVAANNADMVDFTLQGWYDQGFGDGQADELGCDWEEILLFDAVCCGSNVD